MGGNILFLGNKIFEIPPFFQTRPGDLGKKVHACSLRFSALNVPTAILFLHVVLWPGFFAANAEEMSTIATFVATAGKVS